MLDLDARAFLLAGDRWGDPSARPRGVIGLPCEPGSASATGFEPCTLCEPGTFASSAGATQSEPCGLGTYADSPGLEHGQITAEHDGPGRSRLAVRGNTIRPTDVIGDVIEIRSAQVALAGLRMARRGPPGR